VRATLRTKLLLAQLPLVIALGVTILIGSVVARDLGRGAQTILRDNYRSVLAAERMKEAAERVDSGLAFLTLGRGDVGRPQISDQVPRFEAELGAQEANITEPGEREATATLRAAWTTYRATVSGLAREPLASDLRDRYFSTALPEFLAVKHAADTILTLNQDAMTAKSDRAGELANRSNTWLVLVSFAGLVLGLGASSIITTRVLRPLSVLGQTARRLGEGDLVVRARVDSGDEIGELAQELNAMAEHLQKYRDSSLGELLEAQLAAQATIDSLPDPVLVVALDGALRHANVSAETLLKTRAEAGANGLATAEPAVRAVVERLRLHVAGGHGAYVPKGLDEAVRVAASEGERSLLPRAAPLYAEEGDVVGVTIVFQDVTRLRRFEELRNDLVATVAHEFRTPLTSLRMAVHLLAEETVGPLTAKQADLVFAAREECDRLQAIVDELLDLSRIEADRMELRTNTRDPEELVAEALDAQRSAAAAKQVTLRSELLPGMPAVEVDRERIGLVFANLIGNAIHHGPAEGTVTVRASVVGDHMRFEVSDEGPGVPKELHEVIFDKYTRAPGAASGGAGLGLFIARENVRAHGGEIGIAAGGPGATIWFTVKIAAQAP
jgi:signal transduction histidine kinase/HAMP domain-containing protein